MPLSIPRRCAGGSELAMEVEAVVNTSTVRRWLEGAAASVREQRAYLTQLDAAIGDADHGTNMDRGFTAVVEKLESLEELPPGKVLTTAGSTLVSTVGGASGPLWGTALRRAGRSLGDAESFDGADLLGALEAALEGVVELGAAQEGDRTMVDALAPAVRALREELADVAEELGRAAARLRDAGVLDEAEFIEANRLMAEDPALEAEVAELALEVPAATAVARAAEQHAALLADLDDPLLSARAADVRELGRRAARLLAGSPPLLAPARPAVPGARDPGPGGGSGHQLAGAHRPRTALAERRA